VQEIIAEMSTSEKRRHRSSEMIRQLPRRKCDNARMARKPTRRATSRTTEWNLVQPLAFPPKINRSNFERLAREAVEQGMRGPFKTKRQKRKKK
jgi:hypothetical protein